MTREEAKREIDSLDFYLQNHTDDYGEESHTAMMMAIEALEQQTCEDAVSREAVLDIFADNADATRPYSTAWEKIRELPPVNPQSYPDSISRTDMLDAIGHGTTYTSEDLQRIIKTLPPVNPQTKTGHWIDDKCSVCGKGIEDLIDSPEWYEYEQPNFCPFCGLMFVKSQEKQCANCNHYGKLSLDCGRCDDDCSMFEPQESEVSE